MRSRAVSAHRTLSCLAVAVLHLDCSCCYAEVPSTEYLKVGSAASCCSQGTVPAPALSWCFDETAASSTNSCTECVGQSDRRAYC